MSNVIPLQCVPEEHPSDEAVGEHQSLSLHLSHHLHVAGPQHHPRLQYQRKSHTSVRNQSHANETVFLAGAVSTHSILSVSHCRFKTLNDINSNHFTLFHSGSRWLSFLLDFMAAIMTLFVTLFVVLSNNEVISPSLKGLALSYTIQVRHNFSKWAFARTRPVLPS